MVEVDGSQGEGGGQILRSSLSLSILTGKPVRINRIRQGRKTPGLMQQHLACVRAAQAICGGEVTGNKVGSREVTLRPGDVQPGDYQFTIGTAGSTSLVLQTILPPLLTTAAASTITLSGGTHNSMAPPYDFMARAFFPQIRRMGPAVSADLLRHGFFPRGGGLVRVQVRPTPHLMPISIVPSPSPPRIGVTACVAGLSRAIAEREVSTVAQAMRLAPASCVVQELPPDRGPANIIMIELEWPDSCEIVTGFGRRGYRAEDVARDCVHEARAILDTSVPVGSHLADQLLLPMAMAGGGQFITIQPTPHFRTNAEVIAMFMPINVTATTNDDVRWTIQVNRTDSTS